MGKIVLISLKLNFTLNTLGCYGLKSLLYQHRRASRTDILFFPTSFFFSYHLENIKQWVGWENRQLFAYRMQYASLGAGTGRRRAGASPVRRRPRRPRRRWTLSGRPGPWPRPGPAPGRPPRPARRPPAQGRTRRTRAAPPARPCAWCAGRSGASSWVGRTTLGNRRRSGCDCSANNTEKQKKKTTKITLFLDIK